jgi:hypothetical protein
VAGLSGRRGIELALVDCAHPSRYVRVPSAASRKHARCDGCCSGGRLLVAALAVHGSARGFPLRAAICDHQSEGGVCTGLPGESLGF